MTETDNTPQGKHPLLARLLYMILMGIIFQICGTLLFALAAIQFVLAVITDAPNPRLARFSQGLGSYLRQIVWFLTFASEELPFPFNDWPGD